MSGKPTKNIFSEEKNETEKDNEDARTGIGTYYAHRCLQ